MEKILPQPLPEIVFGSSESVLSRAISRKALKTLHESNAFLEPHEGELKNPR